MSAPTKKTIEERKENLKVIYNKELYAKQRLAKIEKQLQAKEQSLEDMKRIQYDSNQELNAAVEANARKQEALGETLKEAKAKLNDINASIAERTKYQKDQEQLIADAMENYNIALQERQADIATTERLKGEKLRELAELNEQIDKATTNNVALQGRTETLQAFYDEQVAKFRIEIGALQAEKHQADADRRRSIENVKVIMVKLSATEQQLTTREKILEDRERQLADGEKLLATRRRLAG